MRKLSEALKAAGKTDAQIAEALSGEILEYQGKKLSKPISYTFDADQYVNVTEVREAGDWPNDADVLKGINQKLATAAKASAYQTATKDLKAEYEASADYKRAQFIKAATAAGFSEQEATAMAAQKLG